MFSFFFPLYFYLFPPYLATLAIFRESNSIRFLFKVFMKYSVSQIFFFFWWKPDILYCGAVLSPSPYTVSGFQFKNSRSTSSKRGEFWPCRSATFVWHRMCVNIVALLIIKVGHPWSKWSRHCRKCVDLWRLSCWTKHVHIISLCLPLSLS